MSRLHHPILVLLIATFLWSIEAIWVKAELLSDMPATAVLFYKFCFGAIFLLPLSWRRRAQLKKLTPKHWLKIVAIAAIGSVFSGYVYTEALNWTDVGTVLLFEKLQPLFVVILGILFLHFRPPIHLWLVMLCAVLMSYLIVTDGNFSLNPFNSWWLPVLLVSMPLGFAIVTILAKNLLSELSPILVIHTRIIIALVIFFALFILPGGLEQLRIPELRHVFWLAMSGFWSFTVAFALYYKGLQSSTAIKATVVELSSPIFGIVGGYFWLGEVFSPLQIFATGLLLAAVFAVTRYESSRL